MKLSHRIFLGYFLVVAIAGIFLLISIKDELRPAVRQSMEETLVDTANLLAEIVEREVQRQHITQGEFAAAMRDYLARQPNATIWGLTKGRTSFRIYITDEKGIVIYDSNQGKDVGKDYAQWNDVYLTLQGKYGARSTRVDPDNPETSTMHVAAAIRHEGRLMGVLTIAKPIVSIVPFIKLSQRNMLQAGLVLLAMALVLGWIFAHNAARSTRKLAAYARQVSQGGKAILPSIGEPELAQLGEAMESMRTALEGRAYVERYIHTLTHEIKSPLSGIRGASELLTEEMLPEDRKRFVQNIKEDAGRIQVIIDRLLELAKLEQQQALAINEPIIMPLLVEEIITAHAPQLVQKKLTVHTDIAASDHLTGDAFLIRQAVVNLLTNAMDFSPEAGVIQVRGTRLPSHYVLTITDAGQGIPAYAKDKIFERFYSLPRPDTGKKSSGLGLSFVQEVMQLHRGEVVITSGSSSGCEVTLTFPLTGNGKA